MTSTKVLFVTRHTPLPWEDGAGAYLHDIARYLGERGIQVEILWLKPHDHLCWQGVYRLPEAFASSVRLILPDAVHLGRRYLFPRIYWLPFKARSLNRIRTALAPLGLAPRRKAPPAAAPSAAAAKAAGWSAPPSPGEHALVARIVRARRPDTVVACYAWLCPLFNAPELASVGMACLTYDVAWKRSALGTPPTAPDYVTPEREAEWLRLVSHLIAITPDDATELARLAPDAEVLLAPKASSETTTPAAPNPGPRLAFVGSGNAFNAEGLTWFLDEVWPRIRAARPDCTLEVAGNIDRAVALRPEGVQFLGRVDDLGVVYARAAVVVVPLLRATGLNIKLVEAAAHGKAIVATPVALASSAELARSSIAAGTPEAFAVSTLRLLADPEARTRAEAASRETIRRHFSPDACYGPVAERLSRPLPSRVSRRAPAPPAPVA